MIDNGYEAFFGVFENALILGSNDACMMKYTKKYQFSKSDLLYVNPISIKLLLFKKIGRQLLRILTNITLILCKYTFFFLSFAYYS